MKKSGLLIALVLLAATATKGMFMVPNKVPADRLIPICETYLKENPEDAHGYYTLGRIHYLVFANRSLKIEVNKTSPKPQLLPDWRIESPGSAAKAGKDPVKGKVFGGYGADTDIIIASAKAYIAALNRMVTRLGTKYSRGTGGPSTLTTQHDAETVDA